MKIILLLLAVTFLAGCHRNSTHDVWVHPEKTQQQFYRDSSRCEAMADGSDRYQSFGVGAAIGSAIRRNRIFSNCMMGEGWNEIEVADK